LESGISNAQIIDVSKLNVGEKIVFGAQVTLADVETDQEVCYRIVGDLEADIKLSQISVLSPLARALIGKEVGDEVAFNAPGGEREYEIIDVDYST